MSNTWCAADKKESRTDYFHSNESNFTLMHWSLPSSDGSFIDTNLVLDLWVTWDPFIEKKDLTRSSKHGPDPNPMGHESEHIGIPSQKSTFLYVCKIMTCH